MAGGERKKKTFMAAVRVATSILQLSVGNSQFSTNAS
jgi:hypothetical protein